MDQSTASKENHFFYNKRLKSFARSNRNSATKAEACLWKYVLRAGMMKGYGFRRQRPVLNYIADFLCKPLMLVIEVDGYTHQFEDVHKKDVRKQRDLESAGFIVIRFTDDEVLHNIENVRLRILAVVDSIESKPIAEKERTQSPASR
ncbi:MAG: endonuclease domain-containing protein [Bacteroidota bacterium]